MEGKIGITIKSLIPGDMENKEIFEIIESVMENVKDVLEERGIIVEDYKIKVTLS